MHISTTMKLININRNINRIFLLRNCDELYQQNSLSLYLLINTGKNNLLVYTNEFIMEKKK